MSSYSPKHLGSDESISAQLQEAGRKVLCGTMSLILAASLVPAPAVSYAEDVVSGSLGSDAKEADSDAGDADVDSNSEMADETPADQQPSSGDEQTDNSGDNGANADDDQEDESSNSEDSPTYGNASSGDVQESTGSQDDEEAEVYEDNNQKDDLTDKDGSTETAVEPDLEVELTGHVEGTANQYKNCKVILKLTGTNLQVDELAIATLRYTYVYTDAEGGEHENDRTLKRTARQFASNTEGTEVSIAFPLNDPGTYREFTANISGITYDEECISYELSGETLSVAGPLQVLDNDAPKLVSVTLENKGTKLDVIDALDDGLIAELGDASSIVVRLNDDSLNTDESVSFVQLVNEQGNSLEVGGKLAWGFEKESNDSTTYVATINNLDDKIQGKIAIRVVAQTYGATADESLDEVLGGSRGVDEIVKADGSVIIDGSLPVVVSVTVDPSGADVPDQEDSGPSVFLTNSEYLEVVVSDEYLDTDRGASYIQLEDEDGNVVKDEDGQEKVAAFKKMDGTDERAGYYKAVLNNENIPDGRYIVRVIARDTFYGKGDDAAQARHQTVKKSYGTLVLDRENPRITDVVAVVENKTGPVEKRVRDNDKLRGNELIVSVEDDNSINEENSIVTFTKKVDGKDVVKVYSYKDCKSKSGDFQIEGIETGTYDIAISIIDSAGNPASQTITNVTFDCEMPQIASFSYDNDNLATYKGQKIVRLVKGGAQVKISVNDYSFDADKVRINVTRKVSMNEEEVGEPYGEAKLTWDGSTATLAFAEEGIYTIEVSAEDALGNGVAQKTETFVASAQPVVTVKLDDDSPWKGAVATTSDKLVEGGQYFNSPVIYDVTITGLFIDLDETKIASVPLSQVDKDKGYKNEDGSIYISKPLVQENGSYTYVVTYGEGTHPLASSNTGLLVAEVNDWYAVAIKEAPVVEGEFQSFTVDTQAPTVMFSESNPNYVNLNGLGIGATDGRVLFFNQGAEGSDKKLTFVVADNVGIKSVEIKRSNADDVRPYDRIYEVKDGEVVVELSDDVVFLDIDELIVTDMAGNTSVWSLKEIKSNPAAEGDTAENEILGVKQPIKLIEDHTAPVLKFKDQKDYYAQDVSVPLTIIERNLEYLQTFAGETISPVVVERKDDKGKYQKIEDITFPIENAILISDQQFEWELPVFIQAPDDHTMDGDYRLTARLTDLAGNASNEASVEFTIDTKAPESTVTFKNATEEVYANGEGLADVDGRYYAVQDGEVFKKIVTIEEHEFNPADFEVIAEPIDTAASDSAPTIERVDSGDTHTYTVSFPSEGKYRLTVKGNDNAGNPLETVSEEFYVDYNTPEVAIAGYPSKSARDSYAQVDDGNYVGSAKDGADYFADLNTITATIVERYLDPVHTTVNGEKLIDILAGAAKVTKLTSYAALLKSVSAGKTYVSKTTGISYRISWDAASFKYTILIDYPDGEFSLPIVDAHDRRGAFDNDDKVDSKADSFVVDGKAPRVSAYITTSPSVLTKDARGTQIPNGRLNGDARVYFYRHENDSNDHEIWFEVKEEFGIRSIELLDDRENRYVLDRESVAASVEKVQTEGGTYIFRITESLVDARDFSNEIKVKITDFAGNYYIWSMSPAGEVKEGGSDESSSEAADLYYKANEEFKRMHHPTLLVEDNVAPVLALTDVAGKGWVTGYERFFRETQGIGLIVLERNLKYLRGYEAPDGTSKFDGLDPNRTVLTVERRENKAGEKLLARNMVPVSSLEPDLGIAEGEHSPQFVGTYTYSREFRADQDAHSEDGHYLVSAQLIDLTGNESDTIDLKEFTIDTKAPKLNVSYKSNDKVLKPSKTNSEGVDADGMPTQGDEEPYYRVMPTDGLTAVIRVDEHNFAPELFCKITAEQLDYMDGDAKFEFTYDQDLWVAEGDTYTYEIHFPSEGKYKVHVEGQDKAGNPVEEYNYIFNVDMYDPVLEVTFPNSKRTKKYDASRGREVIASNPSSTIFFSEVPEVVVSIADRFLATDTAADTTVNGMPLAEILRNVKQSGSCVQETRTGRVTYTSASVDWSPKKHAWVYKIRMTYHDGEYDTPLVYAADRSGRVAGSTGHEDASAYGGVAHFVVDCSAPVISGARITAAPAPLTKTAGNKEIKNGTPGNGENRIWFFKGADGKAGSDKHAIELTVNDPHGIRSVELYDPSGRYRLYEDGEEGALTALVKGESASFYIIDTLADGEDFTSDKAHGRDFSNEVVVRVTDFAGNWHEWSMREGRLYDVSHRGTTKAKGVVIADEADLYAQVRTLLHPTLLVEDNMAPTLALPEIPSNGVLRAKGYGRFFNTTQGIELTVLERNLKYLRGYEGFKGLDPNRSVLTIRHKADKYDADYQTASAPAYVVRVKDLLSTVVDGIGEDDARFVGKYSISRQFTADFDGHAEDGHYLVSAHLVDLVGNESKTIDLKEFTIDTKAPEFTVVYNDAPKKQTANGRDYYDAARTATITVVEHNFDPELFTIDLSHFVNHASNAEVPSYSWDDSHTDTHTCTVEFPSDGEYRLVVSGKDKAGNAAVLMSDGRATKQTTYDSGLFVIDTENPVIAGVYDYGQAPQHLSVPVVQFPQPTGQYAGKNYYSHPIEIYSYVMDRNFDPASTQVYKYHNGAESLQDVTWSLNGGRDQNAYEVYSTTVTYTQDGDYRTPHVKSAVDFAMRNTENTPTDFVVDLVAPSISVEVDRTPTSTGTANDAGDPIQFFNVATRMTFSMHDDHLIRKFWLDDPEGEYVASEASNNVEGNPDATLVISLRDGADVSHDTEYERDITLTVQDLAGNRRIWTIDRTGKVVTDQVESGDANRSINEEGIYPFALIQDTTAPTVTLGGVTEGSFYNSTQSVRCDINEFNFDYLKRFDPSRVIVHVTKYEGNAGRAQSSWTVSAAEFAGSSPNYSFDQAFEGDGHYEVYAEFLDYANNQSGRASIGEFTIDKTAPVINITWDNNDVLNGKYYKAGRTATITVTEHNFDTTLFTINSNGSIGSWSSSGDTHTCTVSFDSDGTYNLSVSGRDKAGNEATSVTEPEFVVDLTSPKITFSGLVQRYGVDRGKKDADGKQQLENEYRDDLDKDGGDINAEDPDETLRDRHAYNGIVMPAIEFYDQVGNGATNYDSQNVSYTLTGGKHGTNTQNFSYTVQDGKGGQTYQFDDFGLVTESLSEGGHNVYDPAADDVYTIEARMTDLAGNEAQGKVTFSVNRYGSNFVVEAFSVDGSKHESIIGAQSVDGIDYDLLGSAPRIEVHEINVSGSESEADHAVLKEYANAVTPLDSVEESDARRDGYVVDSAEPESSEAVSKYGWSEYVYTIREGNFGIDSPSDSGDGGQGVYRVNVTSVDRASNDTSTSEYLNTADYEEVSSGGSESWANPQQAMQNIAGSLRNATVAFTLDEIAPIIDELNVPNLFAVGSSYAVTVHVTDAITRGDTVSVYVDGRELEEGEFSQRGNADGTGTYEFQVATNYVPFATHEVKVVASDTVEGRNPVTIQSERFMVTILVPEIAVIALIVGGITGGVVLYRKRKAVAEPDEPYSY